MILIFTQAVNVPHVVKLFLCENFLLDLLLDDSGLRAASHGMSGALIYAQCSFLGPLHPLLDLGLSGNYHVLFEPLLLLISDLLSLAFHVFLGILIPNVNLPVSLALLLYVVSCLEHKEDRIFDFP